jgi:uncharacterized membrane protein YjgN (DUF898 family)
MSSMPPPPQGPQQHYVMPNVVLPPNHPSAVTAMVLGIVGLAVCGVCGPFAWVIGRKTVREIDASNGQIGGRGHAQAGYVMGIVATVLLVLSIIFVIIVLIAMAGTATQIRDLGRI